jgi:hypothetical protein
MGEYDCGSRPGKPERASRENRVFSGDPVLRHHQLDRIRAPVFTGEHPDQVDHAGDAVEFHLNVVVNVRRREVLKVANAVRPLQFETSDVTFAAGDPAKSLEQCLQGRLCR